MQIQKILSTAALIIGTSELARGQSIPIATQQIQISAFGAVTPVLTNLGGGKNIAVTAGADIIFVGLRQYRSALEIRGTYPIADGSVNKQKSFVAGPTVEYPIGRFRPYADFLVGRGAVRYLGNGYVFGNERYISSSTFVYSPGLGLNYIATHHLAFKADLQYQNWNVPTVPSGSISPLVISIGWNYMFDFNSHHNRDW